MKTQLVVKEKQISSEMEQVRLDFNIDEFEYYLS